MTALLKTGHTAISLWLALAAGVVCLAADAPTFDLPDAADSGSDPSWVLVDLDGNDTFDLATTQSTAGDSGGYAHEILVDLGSLGQTAIRFQSHRPAIALRSGDVDGDHNPDLLVVEPFSREPLAVWINDGAGAFHQGDLKDFPRVFGHSTSTFLAPNTSDAQLMVVDDDSPFLVHAVDGSPQRGAELLELRHRQSSGVLLPSDSRSRAPPARF